MIHTRFGLGFAFWPFFPIRILSPLFDARMNGETTASRARVLIVQFNSSSSLPSSILPLLPPPFRSGTQRA